MANRPQHRDLQHSDEAARDESSVHDLYRRDSVVTDRDDLRALRFVRRVQAASAAALQAKRDVAGVVRNVLDVVCDEHRADAAAAVLVGEQRVAAAAGAGSDDVARACADDRSGLCERIASAREPIVVDTACVSGDVAAALARAGVRHVLGVRLPRPDLRGALLLGTRDLRRFGARERRRFASFAELIALSIENAKLLIAQQKEIEALEEERAMRERFVAVLAHDLRGPLATAKLTTSILRRDPQRAHELVERLDQSLARVDTMIVDLLDANRIHAGWRMSVPCAPCDLVSIASNVVDDMTGLHGERFIIDAEEHVEGVWSPGHLRRALWNLVVNAVKYGDADRPVTIRVKSRGDVAVCAVHNYGAFTADVHDLYRPFARGRVGAGGWGLGLTLVRGCAEAHGGALEVDASASGTTFTMVLPRDSRPYQSDRAPLRS